MPHPAVAPELQARFEQNMDYLKTFNASLFELLEKHEFSAEIQETDTGVNIFYGGEPYYRTSIDDVALSLKRFIKKPNRLLIGSPSQMKNFNEPELANEWPTSAYDEKGDDIHAARFVHGAGKEFEEAGITFGDASGQPFYVICYGVGCGRQLLPLIKEYKPRFLVVADRTIDGLYASTFFIDWAELTEFAKNNSITIKYLINDSAFGTHEAVRSVIMTTSLCGLDGIHAYIDNDVPQLRQAYFKLMDQKTGNMANFIGFTTDEFNMMKNSFKNLRTGTTRILATARRKLYRPVLIVGSGPSLEDQIDDLKKVHDRFVIISSGSSARVLLAAGIKPDFHCNLERSITIADRQEEVVNDGFSLKDTYAVMSTTVTPALASYFKDTIYFIRPALSPVGVFADSQEQILYNEGPQVTNTAFAFARRLAAKEIYLLGVDLGTSDSGRPRAKDAWKPMRPRKLTIPVRGNKGRTVFTDMALLQQRDTLEGQIRKLNEIGGSCRNLGHGAKIAGAPAASFEELDLPMFDQDKSELVHELFEQFPVYTRGKFETNWSSVVVREQVARFTKAIHAELARDGWTNEMLHRIEDICQYINKSLREQYAPRLFRGSFLRMMMHSQTAVMRAKTPEDRDAIIEILKRRLGEELDRMTMEAYSLADELESQDQALLEIA